MVKDIKVKRQDSANPRITRVKRLSSINRHVKKNWQQAPKTADSVFDPCWCCGQSMMTQRCMSSTLPLAELPSDCIVAVSCSSSASTGRLCAASAAIRQSLVHMQRGSSTTLRTCRGKGLTFCSRLKATCVCHRLASSTLSRADRKVQDAVAEANHTLVDRVSQENIQAVNSSSDEPETDLPAKLWDGSTWHRPGMDKTRAFRCASPHCRTSLDSGKGSLGSLAILNGAPLHRFEQLVLACLLKPTLWLACAIHCYDGLSAEMVRLSNHEIPTMAPSNAWMPTSMNMWPCREMLSRSRGAMMKPSTMGNSAPSSIDWLLGCSCYLKQAFGDGFEGFCFNCHIILHSASAPRSFSVGRAQLPW